MEAREAPPWQEMGALLRLPPSIARDVAIDKTLGNKGHHYKHVAESGRFIEFEAHPQREIIAF